MKNPKKFYILGIDPGLLTGITLYLQENKQITRIWAREVDEVEVDFLIEETIKTYAPDLEVINEKFFITEKTYKLPDCPWSLEKTGVIKYMCNKYGVAYNWQSPTEAKTFVPDERLRNLDEWFVGGEGHARDAIRHVITHVVKLYRLNLPGLLSDDEDE
jgi:hypothetical protein